AIRTQLLKQLRGKSAKCARVSRCKIMSFWKLNTKKKIKQSGLSCKKC
ncbi:hypothetical protein CISIN_1g0352232mg, partial [Citrus sinensis]